VQDPPERSPKRPDRGFPRLAKVSRPRVNPLGIPRRCRRNATVHSKILSQSSSSSSTQDALRARLYAPDAHQVRAMTPADVERRPANNASFAEASPALRADHLPKTNRPDAAGLPIQRSRISRDISLCLVSSPCARQRVQARRCVSDVDHVPGVACDTPSAWRRTCRHADARFMPSRSVQRPRLSLHALGRSMTGRSPRDGRTEIQ